MPDALFYDLICLVSTGAEEEIVLQHGLMGFHLWKMNKTVSATIPRQIFNLVHRSRGLL